MTGWVDFTINAVEKMDEARRKTPEERAIEAGRVKAENVYRGFEVVGDASGWTATRIGMRGGMTLMAADADTVRRAVDLAIHLTEGGAAMGVFRQGQELFGVEIGGLDLRAGSVQPKDGPNKTWFVKLAEIYKKYNIYRHDGVFYAVLIGIGDINLTRAADRQVDGVIPALSLAHAKALVDEATA
jgi:hypothetical protein